MTANTTTMIQASDFTTSATDLLRDRWTLGKLRHLVAAARGHRMIVQTSHSGHAVVGYLEGSFDGGAGRGARLSIRLEHPDGTSHVTHHYAPALGSTMVVMPDAGPDEHTVKWVAVRTFREEQSQAIRRAKSIVGDGDRWWGRWEAVTGESDLYVTFEPLANPPAGYLTPQRQVWTIPAKSLQAEPVA